MTEQTDQRNPVADAKSLAAVVDMLRSHGAQEIYVFGSRARGGGRADADLDLAVLGLPPERFFPALARATLVSGRPIDLIDLDEDSLFVRHLKHEGLLRRVG